jgi:hypothetical protein
MARAADHTRRAAIHARQRAAAAARAATAAAVLEKEPYMRRVQLEVPDNRPWWGGERQSAAPGKGWAPIDREREACERAGLPWPPPRAVSTLTLLVGADGAVTEVGGGEAPPRRGGAAGGAVGPVAQRAKAPPAPSPAAPALRSAHRQRVGEIAAVLSSISGQLAALEGGSGDAEVLSAQLLGLSGQLSAMGGAEAPAGARAVRFAPEAGEGGGGDAPVGDALVTSLSSIISRRALEEAGGGAELSNAL